MIALLKSIARNLIIDKWRSNNNKQSSISLDEISIGNAIEKRVEEHILDQEEVKYALSLLKEEQHKIISYRLLQGYSIKETALMIGKNETYVRVAQFRAIEFIKNHLKKERMEG